MAEYRAKRALAGIADRGPDTRGFRDHKCRQLRRKYGITLDQFEGMMAAQDNKCKICAVTFAGYGKRTALSPVVDHCHEAGHIRGLLCHNCNVALGHFRDDPALLVKAIEYLSL